MVAEPPQGIADIQGLGVGTGAWQTPMLRRGKGVLAVRTEAGAFVHSVREKISFAPGFPAQRLE